MANTVRLTLPSLGLSARSALSLFNHIKFFEYLTSDAFYRDFRNQFENEGVLARLQTLARIIIIVKIYNQYTPEFYERTFSLLDSFITKADSEDELANVAMYSDPSIAPALLLPEHSYAEFFDPESEFKSFLHRTIGEKAIRPFFNDLLSLMETHLPDEALAAYETAIKANIPQ